MGVKIEKVEMDGTCSTRPVGDKNYGKITFIVLYVCRFHSDELHNLYYSQDTIWTLKLRRLRWTGHVARDQLGDESLY